jgi:hypothetical protein
VTLDGRATGTGGVSAYNRARCYAKDPSSAPPSPVPAGVAAVIYGEKHAYALLEISPSRHEAAMIVMAIQSSRAHESSAPCGVGGASEVGL